MNNELKINIPKDFQKINTLPKDPPNSVAYGKKTHYFNCFLLMFPINNQNAMPYGNEKAVINGIHGPLAADQGLVGVGSGMTRNQKQYNYSIVKSKIRTNGYSVFFKYAY